MQKSPRNHATAGCFWQLPWGRKNTRGLTSPYLRPFVVARVNYTRFSKATSFDFEEAIDRIIASASKFNIDRVKQEDVAKAGGAPEDEG